MSRVRTSRARRVAGRGPGLAVLGVGLLSVACGGGPPIPDDDLALRVTAGATEVGCGEPFPLTVVRVWRKDLVPAAWDERALAPLALRLTGSARREDDRHVEETRTYRAYAFLRDDVVVTPSPMVARALDGGPERRATAAPIALKVRPALDAAAPGDPEVPAVPPPAPFPWAWLAAAVAAAGLGALGLARRRARARPAPAAAPAAAPAPEVVAADAAAEAALAAIAARDGLDADGRRRAATDVTEVLRGYVAARFGVPTERRTSAEILGAPFAADGAARAALRRVFACGDAVKFADAVPDAAALAAVVDAARGFVRATAPGSTA